MFHTPLKRISLLLVLLVSSGFTISIIKKCVIFLIFFFYFCNHCDNTNHFLIFLSPLIVISSTDFGSHFSSLSDTTYHWFTFQWEEHLLVTFLKLTWLMYFLWLLASENVLLSPLHMNDLIIKVSEYCLFFFFSGSSIETLSIVFWYLFLQRPIKF